MISLSVCNIISAMKDSKRFLPFILTAVLVVVDQISKLLVMKYIPLNTVGFRLFGDFLIICHVRNTGVAFSMGADSPLFIRVLLFVVVPMLLMAFLCWLIATKRNILTDRQKWFVAGIAGGGFGTLVDRIFRFDQGVVDFISVKFYGIFGMDRWPTFNLSDSFVVVFVILFAISVIFTRETRK